MNIGFDLYTIGKLSIHIVYDLVEIINKTK